MRTTALVSAVAIVVVATTGCRIWELAYVARSDGGATEDVRVRDDGSIEPADAGALDGDPPDARNDATAPPTDAADEHDASADDASPCTRDGGCTIDCATERARIVGTGGALDNPQWIFSPVVVSGASACVLLAGPSGRPFSGFEAFGAGRSVRFGHVTPLHHMLEDAVTSELTERAITWAARSDVPVVAIDRARASDPISDWLRDRGWRVVPVALSELETSGAEVWVGEPPEELTDADGAALARFVASGRGAVIGAQAWTWRASMPLAHASSFGGNRILPGSGLAVAPSALPVAETRFDIASPVRAVSHAQRAIDAARASLDGTSPLDASDAQTAWHVLGDAIDVVPITTPLGDALRALHAAHPGAPPTEADPLVPEAAPLDALRVRIASWLNEAAPPEWLDEVLPGDFPGAATGTRERRTVSVDTSHEGLDEVFTSADPSSPVWVSTGLYAAPGADVEIDVPTAIVGRGLEVQVGVHAQRLWSDDAWTRAPDVVRRRPIDSTTLTVKSAYGGPIVIVVPVGAAAGEVDLAVDGALDVPSFTRGDDVIAWRTAIVASGVPWTELVGRSVVLDVPTVVARAIADPEALVVFWDDVVEAMRELAGIVGSRARRERIVYDRQLVGGFVAASGYPVYRGTRVVDLAVDLDYLRANGDWGTWYALGRNHVSRDWLLPNAGSAAPNVVNLFAFHRVLSRGAPALPPPHVELEAAQRAARRSAYVAGGRDFESDWSEWTALETYLQLIESLGWSVVERAIASYVALGASARPETDAERVQQWIRATSDAAALDLVPFYEGWGFPVDPGTRAATSTHPAWSSPPVLP